MKPTKIIQLGIVATTIALIFPPVHYKKIVNGKFVDYISDGQYDFLHPRKVLHRLDNVGLGISYYTLYNVLLLLQKPYKIS